MRRFSFGIVVCHFDKNQAAIDGAHADAALA